MRIRFLLLLALTVLICNRGLAFDLEAYERLDPEALRLAEERMSEFLEPGTARLLREPRNEAERYVVQRQQRLAAEFDRRATPLDTSDGEQVQALFWPVARVSTVTTGADGRARIECQSAQVLLGRTLPDFRAGNSQERPSR